MANLITYAFFTSDVKEKCNLRRLDLMKLTSYGPIPFSYTYRGRGYTNLIHTKNSLQFFKKMITKIQEKQLYKDEDVKAILHGFICHYALDTNLTPYLIYKSGNGKNHLDKYENIEVYLSKYIVENRIGKFRTWKAYDNLFETKIENENIITILNEVFDEVYNIFDGGKKYVQGLKKMYNSYRYFRYDPWGIKYHIYQFLHLFYRNRDIRNMSFYQVEEQDLNLNHNEWKHPCDRNELHNESAIDLYIHALAKATEMIKLADDILVGKEKIEKMDEVFGNLSYVTGKDCNLELPFKYFEE